MNAAVNIGMNTCGTANMTPQGTAEPDAVLLTSISLRAVIIPGHEPACTSAAPGYLWGGMTWVAGTRAGRTCPQGSTDTRTASSRTRLGCCPPRPRPGHPLAMRCRHDEARRAGRSGSLPRALHDQRDDPGHHRRDGRARNDLGERRHRGLRVDHRGRLRRRHGGREGPRHGGVALDARVGIVASMLRSATRAVHGRRLGGDAPGRLQDVSESWSHVRWGETRVEV